jgi:hypothetical protein
MARCQVTSEKSSKNYISLLVESLPEGYPRHPHAVTAHFTRGGRQVRTASANRKCDIYSRESLAEGGGGRGDMQNGAIRLRIIGSIANSKPR